MGLRELKKEQTRKRIADEAWRLFADRGFDQASVADVAREAQVALATVFNYFPSKEDLFYERLEAFGDRLIDAVRTRDAGEPVLVAFRRFLGTANGLLARVETGDAEAIAQARTVNQIIAGSPALQARERMALARTTDELAALLSAENQNLDDVRAYVIANALMGVHRALLDHVRRRVLTGDKLTGLATEVSEFSERAFLLLEKGFAATTHSRRSHA